MFKMLAGNGNFNPNPYNSNGDPFYSDCASYTVTLTCESNLNVATSGKLLKKVFPRAPFQKTLKKGTDIPTDNLKYKHISVAKSLFSEVFEKRDGV